ncbi:hypothetical protein GSF24_16245 [Microbispora triticiradicis]|nr:hypothetical protein [Microbispora triticiradicis]
MTVVSSSWSPGTIAGLPGRLADPVTVELRGEVMMTTRQFEEACAKRQAHDGTTFANPRSAAAGTLRAQGRAHRRLRRPVLPHPRAAAGPGADGGGVHRQPPGRRRQGQDQTAEPGVLRARGPGDRALDEPAHRPALRHHGGHPCGRRRGVPESGRHRPGEGARDRR